MQLPLWVPPNSDDHKLPFDMQWFRQQIAANGHHFWWEWGIPCPCSDEFGVGRRQRTLAPYSSRDRCTKCGGGSYFYTEGQPSVGVVSGYGEKGVVSQFMLRLQPGEMFVSLPPEHAVDMEDRFTDLSVTRPMAETCSMPLEADGPILALRYPIARKRLKLGAPGSPERFEFTSVGVLYMAKANSNGEWVDGSYEEDVHFEITAEGRLDFSLSIASPELGGPQYGERIAVRYFAHPRYKVKEVVREGRDFAILPNELRMQGVEWDCEDTYFESGPIFAIFIPEYRGFRNPPNVPFNPTAEAEE